MTIPHEGYRCLPEKLRSLREKGELPQVENDKLETYAGWADVLISDLESATAKIAELKKELAKDEKTFGLLHHILDLNQS